MVSRPIQRVVAVVLAAAVISFLGPVPALAGAASPLSGRVLSPSRQPEAGAVVALYDASTDATFRSEPTDARGAFRVSGAPAGTYAVVVETPRGAYLAADALRLDPASPRAVSLSLTASAEPPKGSGGAAAPEAPAPSPAPSGEAGKGKPAAKPKLAPWAKWVIVGGIVVGGALVVNAVTKEEKSSPF